MMAILTGVVLMVALGAIAQKSDFLLAAFSRNPEFKPVDDEVEVAAGGSYLIDVLENDVGAQPGDGALLSLVSGTACGAARTSEGKVLYAAEPLCRGAQTAVYCVQRGDDCRSAKLTVNVTAPKAKPEPEGVPVARLEPAPEPAPEAAASGSGTPAAGQAAVAKAEPAAAERVASARRRPLPDDPDSFAGALPGDESASRAMPMVAAVAPPREQPPARRDAAPPAQEGRPVLFASPALALPEKDVRATNRPIASPRDSLPAMDRESAQPAAESGDATPGANEIARVENPAMKVGALADRRPLAETRPLGLPEMRGAVGPQTPPATPDSEERTAVPGEAGEPARIAALSRPEHDDAPAVAELAERAELGARLPLERPARAEVGPVDPLGDAPSEAAGAVDATPDVDRVAARAPAPEAGDAARDAGMAEPSADRTEPLHGPLLSLETDVARPAVPDAGAEMAELIGPRGPDAGWPREIARPDPAARFDFAAVQPPMEGSEPLPDALRKVAPDASVVADRVTGMDKPAVIAAVAMDAAVSASGQPSIAGEGGFARDRNRPALPTAELTEPLPAALDGVGGTAAAPGAALAAERQEDAASPSFITRIAYFIGAIDRPEPAREAKPTVQPMERTEPLPDGLTRVASVSPELNGEAATRSDATSFDRNVPGAEAPVRVAALDVIAGADAPAARQPMPSAQREEGTEPLPVSLRRIRSFAPLMSQRVRLTPDFAGPPRRDYRERRFAELDALPAVDFDGRALRGSAVAGHDTDSPDAAETAQAGAPAVAIESAALRATGSTARLLDDAPAASPDPAPEAAPAPAQAPATVCPATLTALAEPGAMIRVRGEAACRAGEAAVIEHAGLRFAIRFDAEGRFAGTLPAFDRSATLALDAGGGVKAETSVTLLDAARVSRVALVWSDPVDLNLHAFEYDARPGESGHVWTGAETDERGFRRGRTGLVHSFPALDGRGDNVEVYSFNSGRRSPLGVIRMAVEFASRGKVPGEPYCGLSPEASPTFRTVRFENGRADSQPTQAIVAAPCGETVEEAAMYLPDLVRDIVIVQK